DRRRRAVCRRLSDQTPLSDRGSVCRLCAARRVGPTPLAGRRRRARQRGNRMTVANAHSMRGALVRPDWPQLTLDEVQEVLILAGFEHSDARLLWHSPRPLSAAAIVDLPDR